MKKLSACRLTIIFYLLTATCLYAQQGAPRIMINPMGHSSKIQNLIFTPDGSKIISVSEDKTLRIWNVSTGEMMQKLDPQAGDGPEGMLYASALTPDGSLLAVAGYELTADKQVYIFIIDMRTMKQVANAIGHTGAINSLAFSANGKHLISGSDDGTIRIWKVEAGAGSYVNEATINAGARVKFLALNTVTMDLAAAIEGKSVALIYSLVGLENGNTKFTAKQLGKHKGEINKIAYSADGAYFASSSVTGEFNLWNANGSFIKEINNNRLINAIAFSTDSKVLVALDDSGLGTSYGLPNLSVYTQFKGHDNTVFCATFSPSDNENYAVASAGGNNNEIFLWNSINGKVLRKIKGKGSAIQNIAFGTGLELLISQKPAGKKNEFERSFDFSLMKLNGSGPEARSATQKESGAIAQSSQYTLDLPKAKSISNDPNVDGRILDFTEHDGNIIIASDFSLKMYDLDGYFLKEFIGHVGGVRTVAVSPDGRYLASGSEDQTIMLWKFSEMGAAPSLRHFFDDAKWAAFFSELPIDSLTKEPSKQAWKQVIEFLKAHGDKTYKTIEEAYKNLGETIFPFATLFISEDNEWVCWAYKGYFSCSSHGSQYFGWHVNKGINSLADFYAAEQYFDILYRPRQMERSINQARRVEEILKEEGERIFDLSKLHKPSAGFFDTRKLIENGQIMYQEGKLATKEKSLALTVEAYDGGGGIKEVNIYQNDKLVISDHTVTTSDYRDKLNKTYNVDLLNEGNEFRLVVINYQKIESRAEILKVEYVGDVLTTSSLHLLVVGINKYQNSAYNLNYAKPDAQSFAEKLTSQSSRIFKTINKVEIYDEDATKENIINGFKSISEKAGPEDVFVFFYAGHGSLDQEQKDSDGSSQFYFVPSNVTKVYGDPQQLVAKGFSAAELREYLMKIKSTKQIVLMDACHSGGAIKSLKVRDVAGDEKAIVQLARSSGVACIASSGSKQFATEFDVLKHGVFTYVLLEALDGLANKGNETLTANNLKIYMEERVPELTKQYGGEAQYPTGYISGSDFPIAVIAKK